MMPRKPVLAAENLLDGSSVKGLSVQNVSTKFVTSVGQWGKMTNGSASCASNRSKCFIGPNIK